jgi:hypothetical protein
MQFDSFTHLPTTWTQRLKSFIRKLHAREFSPLNNLKETFLLVADSVIPDSTPDCKIVLSGSFEVLLSYSANQIQIPNVNPLMQRFGSDKHVPLKYVSFSRLTVEFIGRISAELATSSRQVGQVSLNVLSSNDQSILKPKTKKD